MVPAKINARGFSQAIVIQMAIMMGQTVCITDPEAAAARDAQMLAARAAGGSPDGGITYPPISSGLILEGSPAAGCYFPQLIADGVRLDDVLGAGHWVIDRQSLTSQDLLPFAEHLSRWLDEAGAAAVLVRPDRHVFGTGMAEELTACWKAAAPGA